MKTNLNFSQPEFALDWANIRGDTKKIYRYFSLTNQTKVEDPFVLATICERHSTDVICRVIGIQPFAEIAMLKVCDIDHVPEKYRPLLKYFNPKAGLYVIQYSDDFLKENDLYFDMSQKLLRLSEFEEELRSIDDYLRSL